VEVTQTHQKVLQTAKARSPDELLSKKDFQSRFWIDVFLKANEINASDIHIEQIKEGLLVRFRVQGELLQFIEYKEEFSLVRNLINRLKHICSLDLSVNDEAQDRSVSFELTNSRYRIALSPSVFGENFVFRIIRDEFIPKLSELYLPQETEADLRYAMNQKQGFICITGPTGSGKSTTLQSILMELDREKKKVITIENPVERIIPSTLQKEINHKVSWKTAIKMALREDPDIILIGEIRDRESAELALEAAQTGHLVFSTLHTNDVAGIVDRLLGLGVEKRLIADNLLFVSAQRLIQRLCSNCKVNLADGYYIKGDGCEHCSAKGVKGIKGRLPIVEYSFYPTPESIIEFDKKNFESTQVKRTLQAECRRWIEAGEVDERELRYWRKNHV
jgi:type II secretory ATPase GspE/PulE/Tfp pilus assembly ATPase PilB-like protein